jgi:hypothetical protein
MKGKLCSALLICAYSEKLKSIGIPYDDRYSTCEQERHPCISVRRAQATIAQQAGPGSDACHQFC